jgi:hypothetical protein
MDAAVRVFFMVISFNHDSRGGWRVSREPEHDDAASQVLVASVGHSKNHRRTWIRGVGGNWMDPSRRLLFRCGGVWPSCSCWINDGKAILHYANLRMSTK